MGALKAPAIFWSFSRLGFASRAKRFDDTGMHLRGKTVVITGANSGIGLAAAEAMIARGAHVQLVCRNRQRGQAALQRVSACSAEGGSAHLLLADLADLSSVRALAGELAAVEIDVLIHNAGSLETTRRLTPAGLEFDLALHLVGPYLLTTLLLPALRDRRGRVLFVSSGGMYSARLSLDAMRWEGRVYDGVRAYAQVKRAQVALVEDWAAREPEVEFHAMHPGWVDTPGVESSLPRFYRSTKRWLRTPAQGADTIVWLASQQPLPAASGSFWLDRESVTRYLLPCTRESALEREALWTALQEASDG